MGRFLVIVIALVVGLVGGWYIFYEGGLLDQVTEDRVKTALLDKGVPAPMAECMAPELTQRLTIGQLRELEELRPREGESELPRSTKEALERLRRVEDEEAVRVFAETGTTCGIEILRQQVEQRFEEVRSQME